MTIRYNIYRNDGRGGPVDFSIPIASTDATQFACGRLPAPGDTTFAVRAVDVSTGIEEANGEARIRIVLDANGNDVTRRPGPVRGLSARVLAGPTCRVVWNNEPAPNTDPPVRFTVSLTRGAVPDLTAVRAEVPYVRGQAGYEVLLTDLPVNVDCVVAIQAQASAPWLAGEPRAVPIRASVALLDDVDDLSGSPGP